MSGLPVHAERCRDLRGRGRVDEGALGGVARGARRSDRWARRGPEIPWHSSSSHPRGGPGSSSTGRPHVPDNGSSVASKTSGAKRSPTARSSSCSAGKANTGRAQASFWEEKSSGHFDLTYSTPVVPVAVAPYVSPPPRSPAATGSSRTSPDRAVVEAGRSTSSQRHSGSRAPDKAGNGTATAFPVARASSPSPTPTRSHHLPAHRRSLPRLLAWSLSGPRTSWETRS